MFVLIRGLEKTAVKVVKSVTSSEALQGPGHFKLQVAAEQKNVQATANALMVSVDVILVSSEKIVLKVLYHVYRKVYCISN